MMSAGDAASEYDYNVGAVDERIFDGKMSVRPANLSISIGGIVPPGNRHQTGSRSSGEADVRLHA
jgi:hypothetical protein